MQTSNLAFVCVYCFRMLNVQAAKIEVPKELVDVFESALTRWSLRGHPSITRYQGLRQTQPAVRAVARPITAVAQWKVRGGSPEGSLAWVCQKP